MRKKLLYFICLLISANLACGQNFEGKIVYKNIFKSKIPNLTDEQLSGYIGDKQEYFIKDGSYKSLTNGRTITMQLYNGKTNRMYNKIPTSDTLYWFDASINTDEVQSYEIKKNTNTILGNQCDELILKTKTGITIFYYSNKYTVDSTRYKNHNYSNWAFYTAKTGALPLKIKIENNQFKMESEAIEITPLKLENAFFAINPSTPIKKSN